MTYLILGHSTPYSLLRLLLVVRLSDPICGSALTGLSLEDGVGTWRMHIGTARDTFCNGSPISIFPSPADRMLCPKNQKCEFLLSCLDKTKSGKKDTQQSKLIYPSGVGAGCRLPRGCERLGPFNSYKIATERH